MTFVLACLLLTALAIAAFSGYYAQLRTHDTAVRKVFGESGSGAEKRVMHSRRFFCCSGRMGSRFHQRSDGKFSLNVLILNVF